MKHMLVLTGLILAMAACGQPDEPPAGGDGAPTPASEVRDSAGVRIVENARPPEGSRLSWRVGRTPVLSIGALEGEEPYLLDGIRDLLTLPDGRIVVANRSSHELRVFGAAGSHLATWGGEGEGPGEFNSLVQVERWPGDSVIAWYSQDRRLSVFDADGNLGRTLRLESDRPISVDAVLRSGAILASQSVPGGSGADGSSREQRRYEVRVAEGQQPASVGSFFGSAEVRIYEIGEDYILGRSTDDLGVEYAQVWSLSRSGG